MTPENFSEILVLIRDDIAKKDTPMREPIPPEIKLAVTIRFLATGTTFEDLSKCFRVHKSTRYILCSCHVSRHLSLGCNRAVHVVRYSKVRRYVVRRHMDRRRCRLLHI